MQGLFAEQPDVTMCINCDAEFTVQEVSSDNGDVSFCPYCGNELFSDEDDINYDEEDE